MQLENALEVVRQSAWSLPAETVPLADALGRVLAEPVLIDLDLPPFDKAMLDGYACRAADLPGPMRAVDYVAAGDLPGGALPPGGCARIMTGAPVPPGADYVFGVEDAQIEGEWVRHTGERGASDNIVPRAQDAAKGDLLLPPGARLNPAALALAASAGKERVLVSARPSVGVLATGSELIPVHETPVAAQIRNSNSAQLAGLALEAGCDVTDYGIVPDDPDILRETFREAMAAHDVVLSSGGVSVGDRDYVPGLLAELGLDIRIRSLAIQPGKPIVFGERIIPPLASPPIAPPPHHHQHDPGTATENKPAEPHAARMDALPHRLNTAVFALAGNPLSSFLQFTLLAAPFLCRLQGGRHHARILRVRLAKPVSRANAARTLYLPAWIDEHGDAAPLPYHGSSHTTALAKADALILVPEGVTHLEAGESADALLL